MTSLEETLKRRLIERKRWESFGGRPILAVWGLALTLMVLLEETTGRMGWARGLGYPVAAFFQIAIGIRNSRKNRGGHSVSLHALWLVGAIVAVCSSLLAPYSEFFTPQAGRVLESLVWAALLFHTGTLKNRPSLTWAGVGLVLASVALTAPVPVWTSALAYLAAFSLAYLFSRD